jgi:hypothetical protein
MRYFDRKKEDPRTLLYTLKPTLFLLPLALSTFLLLLATLGLRKEKNKYNGVDKGGDSAGKRVPGGAVRHTGGTEVLHGLPGSLATPQKEGVGASGGAESELIEGQDLTTSLKDAGAGGLGEPQSAHSQLGELEKTGIIGDGSDNDDDLVLLALGETGQLDEGQRGLVGPAHTEALQHHAVEVGAGPAREEPVELRREMNLGPWMITGMAGRAQEKW